MRLKRLSADDLKEVIRTDPLWRIAAWRELKTRAEARHAFEHANGAQLWVPPNFFKAGETFRIVARGEITIAPLGDGPLTGC